MGSLNSLIDEKLSFLPCYCYHSFNCFGIFPNYPFIAISWFSRNFHLAKVVLKQNSNKKKNNQLVAMTFILWNERKNTRSNTNHLHMFSQVLYHSRYDVNFADPRGMWNAYHMQPEGELHQSRVRVLTGDSVFRSLSYSFDHTNNTFHYLVTELKIYHTFLISRKRAGCLVILNPVEAYSTL